MCDATVEEQAQRDAELAAALESLNVARGALQEYAGIKAELAECRAELGRTRVQLAGCGVVAMADTPESAARQRPSPGAYGHSASLDDVARRVDECMDLRAKLAQSQADYAAALEAGLEDRAKLDAADLDVRGMANIRKTFGLRDECHGLDVSILVSNKLAQAEQADRSDEQNSEKWRGLWRGCTAKVDELTTKLAASQARERELRDALRVFTPEGVPHNGVAWALREYAKARQEASGKVDGRSQKLVEWAIAIETALTRPVDDSALREMLLQWAGGVWALAAPDREMDANTITAELDRRFGGGK